MTVVTEKEKKAMLFCFVFFCDCCAHVSHSWFFLCGLELSLISLQVLVLLSFAVGVNTQDYMGRWHTVTDWRLDSGALQLRAKKKVHRCISVSLRMYRQIPQSPQSNQNCTHSGTKHEKCCLQTALIQAQSGKGLYCTSIWYYSKK